MSILPILISIGVVAFAFLYQHHIHKYVVRLLQSLGAMPVSASDKIFNTVWRTIYLNWYIVLMLLLLFIILFGIEVGKDIIADYLGNIYAFESFIGRSTSLFFLSTLLFLMSVSIWIIPFFIINKKHTTEIENNPVNFYLGTKILALMAMGVYGLVGGAFLSGLIEIFNFNIGAIWINLIFFIIFFIFQSIISCITLFLKNKSIYTERRMFENRYVDILFWIMIWHVLLIIFISLILSNLKNEKSFVTVVPIFILFSSSIVFRLLYYNNDTKLTIKEVEDIVKGMLTKENRKHSKLFYIIIAIVVTLGMLYYFIVPSLAGTNSLYVLLLVFSFIIMYLDYMRRLYRNSTRPIIQILAVVAIIVFLTMPFIHPPKQFNVPLISNSNAYPKITLDSAIFLRLKEINKFDSSNGNIYVVCGMGGGSRAGYITANVLETLENIDTGFLNKTLYISTISGSSPGVYHYFKIKEDTARYVQNILSEIYQRNYNSSGIFGFLFADASEAYLGRILGTPMSLINDTFPVNGYHDRNVRIRREYEIAMQLALQNKHKDLPEKKGIKIYTNRTWVKLKKFKYTPDHFEKFFHESPGRWPIHFINTFEINSGRRTVLSPFAIPKKDTNIFNNSILPLQDTSFDCGVAGKDIMYRDATNLSELFPYLSGASTIGKNEKAQFVDGGYFENYGLATALDVFDYLLKLEKEKKIDSSFTKRIKIILIKNSKQEATIENKSLQIIAPLVGAMQSPFTGHANHFQEIFNNRFNRSGENRFYTVTFNADSFKVPLTRALTRQHITKMNSFIKMTEMDTMLINFLKKK